MRKLKFKHAYIVLKKELKDIFRDKKTWIVTIFLPALFIPIMMYIVIGGAESISEQKIGDTKITVIDKGNNQKLVNYLKSTGISIITDLQNPKESLEKGDIKAIVIIPSDFDKNIEEGKNADVIIQVDRSNVKSTNTESMVEGVIREYSNIIVKERLIAKGIDPKILEPIAVKTENIASQSKMAGSFLAFIVPMLLTLWTATGGMGAAVDLAAGEKERGTLEPLLTTSVSRLSIMAGKYLAVTAMALLSAVASLSGLFVSFVFNKDMASLNADFKMSTTAIIVMFVAAFFTASIFAALELALSAYAKSFKEGQTYISPLVFIAIIPAYMVMYKMPNEIPLSYFAIPVFGTISVFKELLYGIVNMTHIGIFIVSSIVYVSISVYLAAVMFKQEWALFRA
ncbi:ABC transporter permease [Thermoanaerobacter pentosaceus]|uniref:Sodium transport system permease protein n=1 Tax=Thermoanaerobacter pentosaceus TaxID=694059 RepID=A0ABT9M691_9THEO|nr:ABC transporter permease [Thermoanaerobacter pentosaceus]MDP9751651.1 sodium transport system permease protein [Thermoanaerobacter pentosaceus]